MVSSISMPESLPTSPIELWDFSDLYAGFHSPITALDCGQKCAPYNENGVPFCCDTRHAVPTAYRQEWDYLQTHTDLWHKWQAEHPNETARLQAQTPLNQVLIECQGYLLCQRTFRSFTCRAFPFFPYIDQNDCFIGISYYWDYEDRCWVISNLQAVTSQYLAEFIHTYEFIFSTRSTEFENFRYHSQVMRRVFSRKRRAIPLLHRNGVAYKVSPRSGRLRRIPAEGFPRFGPYALAARLPFPDEIHER